MSVSGEVFLDPAAARRAASDMRRLATGVTTGGRCSALMLPGDDAGLSGLVATLYTAEGAAASHLATEAEWFGGRLDDVVAAATGADHFGPR